MEVSPLSAGVASHGDGDSDKLNNQTSAAAIYAVSLTLEGRTGDHGNHGF